jgi:hypothetical protein
MSRGYLTAYLSIPTLIAAWAFSRGLLREPFSFEMFMSFIVGGFLFYAAPHLLWAVISAFLKPALPVQHAGFVAACSALLAILVLSFFAHDPSGLPLQWLLYWPLAAVAQVLAVIATFIVVRRGQSAGA